MVDSLLHHGAEDDDARSTTSSMASLIDAGEEHLIATGFPDSQISDHFDQSDVDEDTADEGITEFPAIRAEPESAESATAQYINEANNFEAAVSNFVARMNDLLPAVEDETDGAANTSIVPEGEYTMFESPLDDDNLDAILDSDAVDSAVYNAMRKMRELKQSHECQASCFNSRKATIETLLWAIEQGPSQDVDYASKIMDLDCSDFDWNRDLSGCGDGHMAPLMILARRAVICNDAHMYREDAKFSAAELHQSRMRLAEFVIAQGGDPGKAPRVGKTEMHSPVSFLVDFLERRHDEIREDERLMIGRRPMQDMMDLFLANVGVFKDPHKVPTTETPQFLVDLWGSLAADTSSQDVEIWTANATQPVLVHSWLLKAASKVLKAQLEWPLGEQGEAQINKRLQIRAPDKDERTVRFLVSCLYTGKRDESIEASCELYLDALRVASQWQMHDLVQLVASGFRCRPDQRFLNDETFEAVAEVAFTLEVPMLRDLVNRYAMMSRVIRANFRNNKIADETVRRELSHLFSVDVEQSFAKRRRVI